MSDGRIRIVLADDHPVVRRGLIQFCEEQEDLEVVGECSDGAKALEAVARTSPDVLIVDLRMPVLTGLEVLARLRELPQSPATVILAGDISDDQVIEAMRLGARGVVLKEMAPTLLVQCIRKVAAGGVWLEKEAVGRSLERLLQQETTRVRARDTLTPRETEIVGMIARGLSNREIGEQLFITEGTVKTHLHTIFEKLEVRSRLQLAAYAREKGLA